MRYSFSILIIFFLNIACLSYAQNLVNINGAYININGGTNITPIYVVVNEPNTLGIVRTSGHIISEGQYNFVRWKTVSNTGAYVFPFGKGGIAANYIPFTFNKVSGNSDVDMSTWGTTPQNMPHPNTSNVAAVTSMTCVPDSVQRAIDRFWDIRATGTTADLTFSYLGMENTTAAPTAALKAIHWNGSTWDPPVGPGNTGVVAGVGIVGTVTGQSSFSPWTLVNYQPPILNLVTTQSVLCYGGNNGSATVNTTNGAPSYTYNWSPSGQTTATLTSATAGTFVATVTDCALNSSSISVTITQPTDMTLTVVHSSITCNGFNNGVATTTVSGGMGGYTYTWQPIGASTGSVNNLAPNTYTIITADINNCVKQDTFTITQPSALNLVTTYTNASCYGLSNGSASVTASGGVGGYTYTWIPSGGNTSTATNLTAGNYTITIADANNCINSTSVNISQPNTFTIAASPNATICFGTSTNLSVTVGGGTAPYNYSWTPNITSSSGPVTVNPTVTTTYQVYATDINNCSTPTQTININVLPALTAMGMSASVCDKSVAVLYTSITSSGNGGPFTYAWSNGASTPSINITADASGGALQTFTVTISDGCTIPSAVATSTLNIYPKPHGSFTSDLQKGCVPLNVNFTGTSTNATDVFNWNFGNGLTSTQANPSTTYTTDGTYSISLEITNSFGCKFDTNVVNYISVYPYPIADFSASSYTISGLDPSVDFYNQSTGAVSYQWNFGDYASASNTSTLTNASHYYTASTGTFNVVLIAENAHGCRSYILKNIIIEPEFHVYIPNVFTPNDNNLNDVFYVKGIGINDKEGFLMRIFDRWGELIYTTSDFYQGWNGFYKGQKAKEDVYIYKIYLLDLMGNHHEYLGHITVLKGDDN